MPIDTRKRNILENYLTSLISAIYFSTWNTSSAQAHIQSSEQHVISKLKFRGSNLHTPTSLKSTGFLLLAAAAAEQWAQAEVNTVGSDW